MNTFQNVKNIPSAFPQHSNLQLWSLCSLNSAKNHLWYLEQKSKILKYLQISFGNASFLHPKLQVLHLPVWDNFLKLISACISILCSYSYISFIFLLQGNKKFWTNVYIPCGININVPYQWILCLLALKPSICKIFIFVKVMKP